MQLDSLLICEHVSLLCFLNARYMAFGNKTTFFVAQFIWLFCDKRKTIQSQRRNRRKTHICKKKKNKNSLVSISTELAETTTNDIIILGKCLFRTKFIMSFILLFFWFLLRHRKTIQFT